MKKTLVAIFLLFCGLYGFSQSSPPTMLVTSERDTLENLFFFKSKSKTNYSQVTYRDLRTREVSTLSSDDVYAYYDGQELFVSRNITGQQDPHLITFEVIGPLKIAYGLAKKQRYYAQRYGEESLYSLHESKNSLDSVFESMLEDFPSFRREYTGKIAYNHESLVTMAESYNDFDPDDETREVVNPDEVIRFGLFAGASYTQLEWRDADPIDAFGIPLGAFIEVRYNPVVAFNVLLNTDWYNFTGPTDDVRSAKLNLEGYMSFRYQLNPEFAILPNFGGVLSLNYKGDAFHPASPLPTEIREFSGGIRLGVDALFLERFMGNISYIDNNFKTKFGILADPDKRFGSFKMFRIGLVYLLN